MTLENEKPGVVTAAVKLLYLTLVIGVVRSFLEWTHVTQIASPEFALLMIVFTSVIMLWLIQKMDQGRNWSRILFALLFVLGIPFSIQPLLQSLSNSPVSGVLGLAQIGLQIIALFMLFGGDSRCWFHPDAPATPSAAPLILLVLLVGGVAFYFLHDSSQPIIILPSQPAITPTPPQTAAVSQPTPLVPPTPTPLPQDVTLTAPIQIPIVVHGKPSGTVTLQRGTRLPLVSVTGDSVTVRYVDSTASIPITSTDISTKPSSRQTSENSENPMPAAPEK